MDVSERLTSTQLARHDYLAASHLHRYAIAASLCEDLRVLDLACGVGYGSALLGERARSVTGVDVDAEAVAAAREEHASDTVAFERDDALTFLRRASPGSFDAVVMFEGLEHVPDPEAVVEELRRLVAHGARLLVSVPNSRVFGEESRFHLTDFGPDEARRAFAGFDGVQWLHQYLAEGSLVLPAGGGHDLAAQVEALEQAEPEYANTLLAVVGFDAAAVERATARLHVVATPNHNRYMLELERLNRSLYRTNRELASGIFGADDSAAAAVSAALQERVEELENRSWILSEEKRRLERRLALLSGWPNAPYHRAVDRAVQRIKGVPGVVPLAGAVKRRRDRRRAR